MCSLLSSLWAAQYSVKSPDGKLEAKIDVSGKVTFSIFDAKKALLENVEIAMDTDKGILGKNAKVAKVDSSSKDENLKPVFGITSNIRDCYNQIELDFKSYKLIFRAYNEAVAYRFVSNFGKGNMIVEAETLKLPLEASTQLVVPYAKGDMSDYETLFTRSNVKSIDSEKQIALPVLLQRNGVKIAVVESDVQAYPMLRFVKDGDGITSYFVKYPKAFKPINNFMVGFDGFEKFIAKTDATRAFPWRAFIVARNDADLSVNTTVYKLAEPSKLSDTSWISTGLCVWEWWADWNLEGVDFETGVNEETYIRFIDFASDNSIPFIVFDAGWLVGRDVGGMKADVHERLIENKPFLNVKKLIDYAHSKNVKVVLWCLGQSLNLYAEKAIPLMKSWGADGMKVDFFNRDDQTAMELYYRIAKVAANYKMLIDFHGCAKPAGLERTYPNVVNFEAVLGLEYNKFKTNPKECVSSSHDVDLVMTRMLQGPMDFTPGAMRNYAPNFFRNNYNLPGSMTTRAHQVALFTLFYAPLQMMCDSPTEYEKYPQVLSFISSTPTNWDESKAIEAKLGEYVVLARRKGDVWYIAGICDTKGKKVSIDLSKIVPEGSYSVEILRDTANSNKMPQDYKWEVKSMNSSDKLSVEMKNAGGFAARLTPEKFPFVSNVIRTIFGN